MGKRFIFIITIAALGLLAAACAPAAAPPAPGGEKPAVQEAKPDRAVLEVAGVKFNGPPIPKGEPKYGGTLVVGVGGYDQPHFDPHQALIGAFHGYVGNAYSGLLRFKTGPELDPLKFGATIIGDMAERWEQPNDRTYILHLKKGIKWQNIPPVNGREFTADDAVYSVERMRTPGYISATLWLDLDSVEALDRYTVKMVTKEPQVAFLSNVANAYAKMVAKEAVHPVDGLKNGPTIGNGAFILEEFKPKVSAILRKNPDFYEPGLPYLDKLKFIQIPDIATRLAAFRTGKVVSGTGANRDENEKLLKANPEWYGTGSISFSGPFVFMKGDRPPFNDVQVRTAVSKAINRQEMIETLLFGDGWFAQNLPLPGLDWALPYEELKEAYKQDVPLAKRLLAEAGHPNGFEVEFTVANYGTSYIGGAEMIQNYLKDVGIKTKIKIIDQPTYGSKLYRAGATFELGIGPIGPQAEVDAELKTMYHSQGSRNANAVNDPKLDQMIAEQARTFDKEKRKRVVHEIQRYLLQQNYALVLWGGSSPLSTLFWPCLRNPTWVSDYPAGRQYRSYWIDPGPVCPANAE